MLEHLPEAVGHALRHRRAGLDKLAYSRVDLRQGTGAITVASLAFVDHGPIPASYTADGEGHSPPLHWTGVPAAASSVVLIVEDADAPTPQPLVHAIVVDLGSGDGALAEGAIGASDAARAGVRDDTQHDSRANETDDHDDPHSGRNSFLRAGWLPPDPPPGHGPHRYAFQVFALGPHKAFSTTPGRDEVLTALAESALASGCLIGCYERADGTIPQPAGPFALPSQELPS